MGISSPFKFQFQRVSEERNYISIANYQFRKIFTKYLRVVPCIVSADLNDLTPCHYDA